MKHQLIFVVIAAALLASTTGSTQSSKSVLFLGNSYTGVNNLPNMVYQAALSAGDTLHHDAYTPGGYRFMHHTADANSFAKIQSNAWDFVVLQAQSQEPSFPWSQLNTELFPHAQTLCDTIRHNHACSRPLFYNTWGRKNGDAMNCANVAYLCTYEGMDSALRVTYHKMAVDNKAAISPVGPVWRYIRANYPHIELYDADESHPSLAGSYAAACVFYTTIFKKDPTYIQWISSLQQDVADSIQLAAKRIAFDSLPSWDHTDLAPTASFTFQDTNLQVHFTATVSNVDSLRWSFGDGQSSTAEQPTHSFADSGQYAVQLVVYSCGESDTSTELVSVSKADTVAAPSALPESITHTSLRMFPNPTSGSVKIDFGNVMSQADIQVMDAAGQLVFQSNAVELKVLTIPSEVLQPGVYIVSVSTDYGLNHRLTLLKVGN